MSSSKRPRSTSLSSTSSTSDLDNDSASKSQRLTSTASTESSNSKVLSCTLPPSCHPPHNKPTRLSNTKELESHYEKYHAHVCEEKRCAMVFPDERLLALHQTECHDPIAAVRKERGEKIFACFLASCPKLFSTPKNRRLHLIQAHGYPKEYFFAVTNKGVGGLLKRWGEGASLIRGMWQAREAQDEERMDEEDEVVPPSTSTETGNEESSKQTSKVEDAQETQPSMDVVDTLSSSMSSLALVPPSIRFGRGGSRNAFPSGRRRGQLATNSKGPQGSSSRPGQLKKEGNDESRLTSQSPEGSDVQDKLHVVE